jgi:hypothetical protein
MRRLLDVDAELIYGVTHAGKVHRRIVIGSVDAASWMRLDEARAQIPKGDENALARHAFAVLAARLQVLGDVPAPLRSDPDWLLNNMQWADVEVCWAAIRRLDRDHARFCRVVELGQADRDGAEHGDGMAAAGVGSDARAGAAGLGGGTDSGA